MNAKCKIFLKKSVNLPMNLFYAPQLQADNKHYIFDKDESRHISRVLRKNIGDKLFLTNGKGYLFTAEITDNHPKKTRINIIEVEKKPQAEIHIHLAIAPTKSNDRFEWFLEKATEIGISEITPILTTHSERKKINWERYDKILVSAMKQSLQMYKPKLNQLTKYADLISQNNEDTHKMIAYCKADKLLKDNKLTSNTVLLLVGPEGGFSPDEMQQAFDFAYQPVALSGNRLRTETAGLVGLMAIHHIL